MFNITPRSTTTVFTQKTDNMVKHVVTVSIRTYSNGFKKMWVKLDNGWGDPAVEIPCKNIGVVVRIVKEWMKG